MKKLFTVLAVLLVASVAFAAFSGEAAATYTFNFDERTVAYGKPGTGSMDVDFKWDSQEIVLGGESDVHIDFKASAEFKGWYGFGNNHAPGYQPWLKYDDVVDDYKSAEAGTFGFVYTAGVADKKGTTDAHVEEKKMFALLVLKVNTFKIVGKDWEVNFLGSVGLDFAQSAIDTKKFNKYYTEENVQNFSLDNSVKGKHNVAVTAFGYKFGFGTGTQIKNYYVKGTNDWSEALTFALTVVTPEYNFNGVTLTAGAGYQAYDNDWALAGSAKAGYATDKLSVSGAFDVLKMNTSDTIANEFAFNLAVAPVTFDAYWNNMDADAYDKYYDYFSREVNADPTKYSYNEGKHYAELPSENYLSAKVVVDIAKVAENVPVKVTLTAKDIVNEDSQIVSAAAETTIVPNFKFGVYFNNMFDFDIATTKNGGAAKVDHRKLGATVEFTGVEKLTLKAEAAYAIATNEGNRKLFLLAGAEYAHDLFTATADVALEKQYEKDAVMGAIFGAKSTTLVAGAELSAKAYFNLNDLDGLDASNHATNKLVLGCKVAF